MKDNFLVFGSSFASKKAPCDTVVGQKVIYNPTAYTITVFQDNIKYIFHLEKYTYVVIKNLETDKLCRIWKKGFGCICGDTQLTLGGYKFDDN